ncbi:3-hydroxyacyl-CoA dehydrogenase NAD-binding domain-containing protein [Rhizobium sp. L1K21]|uniref:3-hydroxyacyl-CoA dehydrogenase NAD-binding domain-containing protein n=1 Tax=Rhizobium sp. L1K21 TaxID=2954933 RepID=UPI0020938382|nr:3-hydroxyacyl-CoA dehydrogenase NAD-binding domain-containing protein [Rhizobium sp. L1K21]MCO6188318.1 3-hydroxyacyl-CoA dehydrogenase NAD-binding domain-containing protein [Rhizobium sp. L1K21]
MTNAVNTSLQGDIFLIEINNPPVNAASAAVREGVIDAIRQFAAEDKAKAAVLYGAGRTFVAGADIREFGKLPAGPMLPEVVQIVEDSEKPVVCIIHGTALGGGLELALGSHVRVALKGSKVGLPEVAIGVMPGASGTQRLPRLIGFEAAAEIIATGRQVSAKEALQLGIVDAIEDMDDPKAAGIAAARRVIDQNLPVRRLSKMDEKVQAHKGDTAFFDAIRADVKKKARGQIAPVRAIDALENAANMPFDEGMTAEREIFMELMNSDQSKALRHAFFAEREVAKVPELANGTPKEIKQAGVIGGGTMGSGITLSMLFAGIPVTMVERDEESAARGKANVLKVLDDGIKKGRYDEAYRDNLMNTLYKVTTDFEALGDCDIIIEAAFEMLEVKQDLFRTLDKVARKDAILASNTSYLDINKIASVTSRPENVLGLHFFSPAHIMKLLEVVVADKTSADAVATGFALAKKLKKIGVRAGVCDGFIGNRILEVYMKAAAFMVEEGTSPYAIDKAVVGFGYPMGPHQMGDLAGLDIGLMSRKRRIAEGYKGRYAFEYLDWLGEKGDLGQKTGRGCYDYSADPRKGAENPEFLAAIEQIRKEKGIPQKGELSSDEIMRRYMAAMINEGAKVVEEGIALRPLDVDIVMLSGYGSPRWRGGPMHYADTIGLDKVLADLNEFAKEDPVFWKPAKLIEDLVAKGENFSSLNG